MGNASIGNAHFISSGCVVSTVMVVGLGAQPDRSRSSAGKPGVCFWVMTTDLAPRLRLVRMVRPPFRTQRERVSHALQRRATLEAMRRPAALLSGIDPCDADPLLVRSALHHGVLAARDCPVCTSQRLMVLNYVFGDQLGQFSGRIKSAEELCEMETEVGEFKVRVVEVCPDCNWNHLIETYVLGDGVRRPPPRRQRTVEDIYG